MCKVQRVIHETLQHNDDDNGYGNNNNVDSTKTARTKTKRLKVPTNSTGANNDD